MTLMDKLVDDAIQATENLYSVNFNQSEPLYGLQQALMAAVRRYRRESEQNTQKRRKA